MSRLIFSSVYVHRLTADIKAVSIVSSFAAVMDIDRPFYEIDKTYTEADWLPVSEEVAENAQDDGG